MASSNDVQSKESMELAEASREETWKSASFVAELFKGQFRWDLIHPYPLQSPEDKQIGDTLLIEVESVLKAHVDPEAIDQNQEMPPETIKALAEKGYFGLKIPKKYGGLGLSVVNYIRVMQMVGNWCGTTAVWLSAHQSIGVPQPLILFGTDAQKQKFLPRLAKGAISAFALTEPDVGSDPAKMSTTATPTNDGHYLINGEKLYITNGTAAELLVVMAVTPSKEGSEKKQISTFIVETNSPGFEILHRCRFMGIRGIANGMLKFKDVKVPKENLIGKEGQGLKIALVTLNTGRLTIPAISSGVGKLSLHKCSDWANKRVQWGAPIGKHQLINTKLAQMAANTFAMESISFLTASFADQKNKDIRLEAAMSKYFGSEVSWYLANDALQIKGGRGFETASSLKARGEDPFPIERIVRDLRINLIIEGTSEIMTLFIAREAMDIHVKYLMALINPKLPLSQKLGVLIKALWFYLRWYPKLWIWRPQFFRVSYLSRQNKQHLRYIAKTSRKLARKLFHVMARYGPKLEREQLILKHFVDIGTELFAMGATLSHLEAVLAQDKNPHLQDATNLFCKSARDRIWTSFCQIRHHHHKLSKKVGDAALDGAFESLTKGVIRN